MTVSQAIADICNKHGLCSTNDGCPLYTGNITLNNGSVMGKYLCNYSDSQELMDKLLQLGYNIDGASISIKETEYWRMYES